MPGATRGVADAAVETDHHGGPAVATVLVAGCAAETGDAATGIRIMVPNRPGSGYDVTARTAAKAFEDAGILREVEVFNLPGTDGTVGLQRLVYEKGNSRLLMLMGLGLVGSQFTHQPGPRWQQTTPIARLMEEPDIIVVTRDSPYRTLDDLVRAWRITRPRSPWAVDRPGGPDHLAAMLSARRWAYHRAGPNTTSTAAVRCSPRYSAGRCPLGSRASASTDRTSTDGQLRVLAVTSDERMPDLAGPTSRGRRRCRVHQLAGHRRPPRPRRPMWRSFVPSLTGYTPATSGTSR